MTCSILASILWSSRYIVVHRKDNGIGKKTYDTWCPSTGGGQRKYTAHMGEGILDDLSTYRIDQTDRIHADIASDPTDDKTAGIRKRGHKR